MHPTSRDAETGYTLAVGRGQPTAAAAMAASGGVALPPGLEAAAAAGMGGAWTEGVMCIIRDGEMARMGGCEEQSKVALQVRIQTLGSQGDT